MTASVCGIAVKQVERVHKVCADNRIAADADGGRLPDAALGQLMHGFVSQRAGARDDADVAFLVNVRGHDADLAFAGRNDSRTVRADQARAAVLQKLPCANHIERRDAFGDADDQFDFRIGRFHDRVGRKRGRHKNHRGIGAGFVRCLLHSIENGPAFVRGAAFARRNAADNLRAISGAGLGMERAFAPSQTLHDQSSSLISQDCHDCSLSKTAIRSSVTVPLPARHVTTRGAPSRCGHYFIGRVFHGLGNTKFRPDSCRIFLPS